MTHVYDTFESMEERAKKKKSPAHWLWMRNVLSFFSTYSEVVARVETFALTTEMAAYYAPVPRKEGPRATQRGGAADEDVRR